MGALTSGLGVRNRVLMLLCAVAAIALVTTGFMSDAPNRLADGVSHPIWHAPAAPALLVASCLAALALLTMRDDRTTHWAACGLAAMLAVTLLLTAASFATTLSVPGHPAQRHALGPAFWIAFAMACLAMVDAMQRLALGLAARAACLLILIALLLGLAAAGAFDSLSLAREFVSHRALFAAAFLRHVALVGAALVASIAVCAPLTMAVRRGGRSRTAIYSVLSLLQTIPSIALFGLLIAPLTALAAHVPLLKSLGISGLGVTPALIALVLYSAFPLVRMSDAAFSAVPGEVAEAARGLGFGRQKRFFAVGLPLALPVLLSGFRVVTLQAIGLATVAALIGGGGLGTFIFEGIGEYALDLVLVGAIPVILLALATDFGFRLLLAAVETPR
jgi:osmoprotectant transport system permease protein